MNRRHMIGTMAGTFLSTFLRVTLKQLRPAGPAWCFLARPAVQAQRSLGRRLPA